MNDTQKIIQDTVDAFGSRIDGMYSLLSLALEAEKQGYNVDLIKNSLQKTIAELEVMISMLKHLASDEGPLGQYQYPEVIQPLIPEAVSKQLESFNAKLERRVKITQAMHARFKQLHAAVDVSTLE